MVFGELTRWRIFRESLGNGFWRTVTLANLWRIFGKWFLANCHFGESFANLLGMVFGELSRCQIFGESLGNGFSRTDTVANIWRMVFGEMTHWRIFGEWFLAN